MAFRLKIAGCILAAASALGFAVSADETSQARVDRVDAEPTPEAIDAARTRGVALPMTFLYRRDGSVVPQDQWPGMLAPIGRRYPNPMACFHDPGQACEMKSVEKVAEENFAGLQARGSVRPVRYAELPQHEWLLVEYGADWCAPCKSEQQDIKQALAADGGLDRLVWLTIDYSSIATKKAP